MGLWKHGVWQLEGGCEAGFGGWGGRRTEQGGGWWVSDKVVGNCSPVNRAAVLCSSLGEKDERVGKGREGGYVRGRMEPIGGCLKIKISAFLWVCDGVVAFFFLTVWAGFC